jgi:outer membrane protein assembly factor BamE
MPPEYLKWKSYPMRILMIALIAATLSACSFVGFPGVYKINVEQGNIVTPEMAAQLKPGMTRRQVKFVLGTPLVEDTFNKDRWDYLYSKRNGKKILSQSRLTVEFDGDTLVNVRGDLAPSDWGAEVKAAETASTQSEAQSEALPEPAPGIPAGG